MIAAAQLKTVQSVIPAGADFFARAELDAHAPAELVPRAAAEAIVPDTRRIDGMEGAGGHGLLPETAERPPTSSMTSALQPN